MKISTHLFRILAISIVIIFFLGLVEGTSAATVQVIPTIHRGHGGQHINSACDIYTQIIQGDWYDQQNCVPTYVLPGTGHYEVKFFPPRGYTYSTSTDIYDKPVENNRCEGVIGDNENVVCYVFYSDKDFKKLTAPPPPPPPVRPASPVVPVVIESLSVSAPVPTPTVQLPSDFVIPMSSPTSVALAAMATTSTSSTVSVGGLASTTRNELEQIRILQEQVAVLLKQLIILLTHRLAQLQ